jgi:2-methylisocitrate lyase-like PEP mutase family enzyme
LLAQSSCLVVPGVFSAISARVMEEAGFPCVYMSGFSVATSTLARPDLGMLGLTEMAQAGARIASAVDVPVLADADTGYGGSFSVRRTVEEYERAGLAGMHLEDQDLETKRCGHLGRISVVEPGEMLERLRSALSARNDPDFFIIARTDAVRSHGLDEALRRAELLAREGPDAIFVEYLSVPADLERVRETTDLPIVTTVIDGPDAPKVAELREAGANIILFPVSVLRASVTAAQRVANALRSDESTSSVLEHIADMADVERAIKLEDMRAWEERTRLTRARGQA